MKTKRILSLLLALSMALGLLGAGVRADDELGDENECKRYGHQWDQSTGKFNVCGAECLHSAWYNNGCCQECGFYNAEHDKPVIGAALQPGSNTLMLPELLGQAVHAFTPEESGVYCFYSDSGGDREYADPDCSLYCGEEWVWSDTHTGDFHIAAALTGGTTYTLRIKNFIKTDAPLYITVSVALVGSTLSAGENTLSATADGAFSLYSFTPKDSGCYRFRSQGLHDPFARLCGMSDFDINGETDDVCEDGPYPNKNFNFTADLVGEKTYVLLIGSNGSAAADIPVVVEPYDPDEDPDPPAYHPADGDEAE